MAFSETPRFPGYVSAWMIGGPSHKVTIVQTNGGDEYRKKQWRYSLSRYTCNEVLMQTLNSASLAHGYRQLRDWLLAAGGEFGCFRFADPMDNTDDGAGVLGTTGLAVAATTAYQMFKNYTVGTLTQQRKILKPVTGVQIFNNGVLQTITSAYTIDTTTGIVTFTSQPTIGHTLTWTGSFDTPVRFDGDEPQMGLETSGSFFDWANLKLVELRNP